jgi:TRAP-type C4-dicarboxylate transport system permease small subunit
MTKRQVQPATRVEKIAARVDRMSRPARIAINMVISLLVVAVLGLPVTLLFAGDASEGSVLYAPSIIVAVIWLIIYGVGWWALVGFDVDPQQPWQAGKPAVWVTVLGAGAAFVLLLEIIFGLLYGLVF